MNAKQPPPGISTDPKPADEISAAMARAGPGAIAHLLAAMARCCPTCGERMAIRTSWQTSAGRLARLRCRACGTRTKRKV